ANDPYTFDTTMTCPFGTYPWTCGVNWGTLYPLANAWSGMNTYPPSATQTLLAATTVSCNANSIEVTAASSISLTATPTITAAANNGTPCAITNTGSNSI